MTAKTTAVLLLIFYLHVAASQDTISSSNSSTKNNTDPQPPVAVSADVMTTIINSSITNSTTDPLSKWQSVTCIIINNVDSILEIVSYALHWGRWGRIPGNIWPFQQDQYFNYGTIFGGIENEAVYKFKDYETYGTIKIYVSLGHWESRFTHKLEYSKEFGEFFEVKTTIEDDLVNKLTVTLTPKAPDDFNVFISGDPQPYRTFEGNDPNKDVSLWESQNRAHAQKILQRHRETKFHFGIINGDITEYGRKSQRDSFENVYVKQIPFKFYLGLGNHDYQNNINDCWDVGFTGANGCAAGSIHYMYRELTEYALILTNYNYDFNFYSGSMAYKFDYGDYTFFQLHDYPSYEVTFSIIHSYKIKKSFNYLEAELAKTNKNVVLCLHDMQRYLFGQDPDTDLFKGIVNKYNIKLIFAGHTHYYGIDRFGTATVFTNRAMFDGGFFTVNFKNKCAHVYKHDGGDYGKVCF